MDSKAFKTAITKDLPVLFTYVGWALRYDGTEAIIGGHTYLQQHPSKTTEGNAFVCGDDGVFSCGIGRGGIGEARMHVVFVAKDPQDGLLKVVGIYADAKAHTYPLPKNATRMEQPWSDVRSVNAKLLSMPGRPLVAVWPGRQGMRRWAKRLATVGNAHSSLDSDFIKLRTLLLGGAGSTTVACGDSIDDESSALEGEALMRFVIHRKREVKLRHEKIATALKGNNNRLICEVPNCGFDFLRRYGNLGFGYAHVHHLMPLREAAAHGRATKLSDLAVVCANCHAMIHRGGECRPLDGLIPKRK